MNDYMRGDTLVRAFTEAEDALITELRIAGMGTTEIAKFSAAAGHPARTQATINMRLKSLAAIEEASDEQW